MKRRLTVLTAVLTGAALLAAAALAAASPSVTTGSSSKIKQTSAVLSATVDPNGNSTTYFFEWGLTVGYGLSSHPHSAGGGTATVSVHTTAGGLIPGTVYDYRIVALNKFGVTYGANRTFKTGGFPPPAAATGPSTQVGPNFVTLTGVVNPNGTTTNWLFQYGVTAAYGLQTAGGTATASSTPLTVSQSLQGLASATIFHYRLVATHGGFPPQYGADQIFMTEPAHPPQPRVQAGTTPGRARHRPFVFTTSGTIAGPGWIPAQFACSGSVKVRFLFGNRLVAFSVAALQPNCGFAVQTALTRRPGRGSRHRQVPLRVLIRFQGNGYLAPSRGRPESVVVG